MARVRTETAAHVRHVVSRGLLVLGGVVAGTAAAWLLSSATASAETQPAPGLGSAHLPSSVTDNPLAHNVDKAVHDVDGVVRATVHGVTKARSAAPLDLSTVVGDLDATLHGRDAGATPELGELGDKAKTAFGEIGADLVDKFGLPRSDGAVEAPGDQVTPPVTGQPGDSSPIVHPVDRPSSAVGPRVATDGFTTPALQDRARMGGLNRGSPGQPALPDPLQVPVSPAPVGIGGHSTSSAGAQDGPAFGALPTTGSRTVLAMVGTSSPAIAGAPVRTGAQPGNTPD